MRQYYNAKFCFGSQNLVQLAATGQRLGIGRDGTDTAKNTGFSPILSGLTERLTGRKIAEILLVFLYLKLFIPD
jgi:hypothetical protein